MVDGRLYLIMIMPCFGVFTLLSDVVVAVMGVKESYHNGVDGRHPAPVTIGRLSIPDWELGFATILPVVLHHISRLKHWITVLELSSTHIAI